jgi:hypothetical protein
MTIAIAAVAFVGLFIGWAVLPTIIKRRHTASEAEDED